MSRARPRRWRRAPPARDDGCLGRASRSSSPDLRRPASRCASPCSRCRCRAHPPPRRGPTRPHARRSTPPRRRSIRSSDPARIVTGSARAPGTCPALRSPRRSAGPPAKPRATRSLRRSGRAAWSGTRPPSPLPDGSPGRGAPARACCSRASATTGSSAASSGSCVGPMAPTRDWPPALRDERRDRGARLRARDLLSRPVAGGARSGSRGIAVTSGGAGPRRIGRTGRRQTNVPDGMAVRHATGRVAVPPTGRGRSPD